MKKNWIYIALLFFIVLINVLPRFAGKDAPEEVKLEERHEGKDEESQRLFVDFEEAKEKSKKIEGILKSNFPLYLFYISINLGIVFLFLLGLVVDGHFIFRKLKKHKIFQKMPDADLPSWSIADIFKIIILGFTLSYIFFIMLGFFIGVTESLMKAKFQFYENDNFRMIFDTIILDFFILLTILGFLRLTYKKRLRDLGFTAKNASRNILYGALGYAGIIPIILMIGVVIYVVLNIFKLEPPPQPIVALFLAEENIGLIFVSSLIASVFGPAIEEIFFRGVMYNAVKRKLGIFPAILITSVLFSFLHTHAATYFLVGFIPIMILGAVLAYLYEKTGSLIPSITLHVLNNLGSVIMVFAFRYFNNLAG
jgi:membrane protease YdiL (CAAX protease family)